ncbi:MAG: beta-ketoacyl synthase N-terminal-like domain-containing protein, partial [Steroidobacteraceae bacterium]
YQEYQLYGAQAQALDRGLSLPGSAASIANRVSYFCNFSGPSLAVDTMCSSSLTAIHLACQSLLRAECAVALAGGVNLSLHPNKYLRLSKGNFASRRGRCHTFGADADGYVPGEGVGAVLLKPLRLAVADRDHIHGVIKATVVNHGGKTNGYTVPNPKAQARVILSALRRSGVPPRAVTYIEAHGTGTSLGDPIEIAGLNEAFGGEAHPQKFCAIGSVKSNIGHCESAAGIAGLTKVLLQFRHRKLAPSLHADSLNPHLDLDHGPLVVQRELSDWHRPLVSIGGADREHPLTAGISAFGAGGSNVHLIVSEYVEPAANSGQDPLEPTGSALVVLSARTRRILQERARQMLDAIDRGPLEGARLQNVAFTSQVGREAMEHRAAMVVSSMADLKERLRELADAELAAARCRLGQVSREQPAIGWFDSDEELRIVLSRWFRKGRLDRIADLWVRGAKIDWEGMWKDAIPDTFRRPRRIPLPTYPYSRERHWFDAAQAPSVDGVPLRNQTSAIAAPSRQDVASATGLAPEEGVAFFEETWEPEELPAASTRLRPEGGAVLVVFLNDAHEQRCVHETLRAIDAGVRCIFVSCADDGTPVDGPVCRVAPQNPSSYEAVIHGIAAQQGRIDAVWYAWPLQEARFVTEQEPILFLLRALAHARVRDTQVLLTGRATTPLERSLLESWVGYERSLRHILPAVRVAMSHELCTRDSA